MAKTTKKPQIVPNEEFKGAHACAHDNIAISDYIRTQQGGRCYGGHLVS